MQPRIAHRRTWENRIACSSRVPHLSSNVSLPPAPGFGEASGRRMTTVHHTRPRPASRERPAASDPYRTLLGTMTKARVDIVASEIVAASCSQLSKRGHLDVATV